MSWVGRIFNEYFTAYDKQVDVNRDPDGKGTFERYIEVSELMLDEEITYKVTLLQASTVNPYTAEQKYVGMIAACLGIPELGINKVTLVSCFMTLANYRSTREGYRAMFSMIGLTLDELEVHFPEGTFDAGSFDMADRTFDMKCSGCVDYEIDLTGTATMTDELKQAVLSIEQFNRPVDAKLVDLRYNGQSLILLGDFNDDFNDDFFTG